MSHHSDHIHPTAWFQLDLDDLAHQGYAVHTPRGLVEAGYGWHLTLDLQNCDVDLIGDADALRAWARGLVDVLGMKAFGETQLPHFGHDDPVTAGYTVVDFANYITLQLIETSSITAHLSPHRRSAHVDVFSCRPFSILASVAWTQRGMGGRGGTIVFQPRG